MTNTRGKATAFLLIAQVIFVVLFGVFVHYDSEAGPASDSNTTEHSSEPQSPQLDKFYPMFQDVHVMIFIGFGFLMTFLKRHGYGSSGFNFLLACYVIQWSALVNGWFGMIGNKFEEGQVKGIYLNIESFLNMDFAAGAVLISFGAILGVASPMQLIVMATIEVVFYNISIFVGIEILGALDVGGSMFIHAFGAYFGLAVARALYKKSQTESPKESSEYHSDLFAMIGTLFLWMYWPSFNAAPASGNERHRAVINTILSLAACTVVTVALSSVLDKKGKLNMVHIQNATLAGGVAMGASADMLVQPFGALAIGSAAAIISTLGYQYLQPLLQRTIKLHDTCGVNNLHGMPGIFGAIVSAIVVAVANKETYKASYDHFFSHENSTDYRITSLNPAGVQIVSLITTLVIAILGGGLTGLLLKLTVWDNLSAEELYEDEVFWECEEQVEISGDVVMQNQGYSKQDLENGHGETSQ